MCIPPAAVGLASAAVSVGGSLMQGRAAASAGELNAANYKNQATLVQEKAKAEVEEAKRKFQRFQGTQLNEIGSSGLDARSFYGVLHDNASEHALEVASIKWSAKNQADQLLFQADAAKAEGESRKTASYISAVGGLVGGLKGIDLNLSSFGGGTSDWTTTVFRNDS